MKNTLLPPGPRRDAALTVAEHSTDSADARRLLATLGLDQPSAEPVPDREPVRQRALTTPARVLGRKLP